MQAFSALQATSVLLRGFLQLLRARRGPTLTNTGRLHVIAARLELG